MVKILLSLRVPPRTPWFILFYDFKSIIAYLLSEIMEVRVREVRGKYSSFPPCNSAVNLLLFIRVGSLTTLEWSDSWFNYLIISFFIPIHSPSVTLKDNALTLTFASFWT